MAAETTNKSQKRRREVLRPELESALLEWFLHYEKDGVISGELIREKAKLLYTLIYPMEDVPILKFSNGGGIALNHDMEFVSSTVIESLGVQI